MDVSPPWEIVEDAYLSSLFVPKGGSQSRVSGDSDRMFAFEGSVPYIQQMSTLFFAEEFLDVDHERL